MKKHRLWTAFWASCAFLILVFDSKTALNGALSGMEICMRSVIPSLFPFFVVSIWLTQSLSGMEIRILRPVGRLFGIPQGAESILIPAFLGGYPAGAQSVTSAYHNGSISLSDARRMLTYCNNAGPAFLFGMLSPLFSRQNKLWLLWGIHITSAFLIAQFSKTGTNRLSVSFGQARFRPDIMQTAVKTMAVVCGWIILFRVILVFAFRWFLWLFPPAIQICIAGILELSNGCHLLSKIPDESLRFVIASGMLSLGGLCVTMQTKSVAGILFDWHYILAKLKQTAFSILLAASLVYAKWLIPLYIIYICLLLFYRDRKNSGIPEPFVV